MPLFDMFDMRILVGVDDSPGSMLAADVAAELCRVTGSELHLVHVLVRSETISRRAVGPVGHAALAGRAEEVLVDAARRAEDRGAEVAGAHVREGTSVDWTLVEAQEELKAELLVIGTSSTGGIAKRLVRDSSVAADTVRRSSGSVLVVRP